MQTTYLPKACVAGSDRTGGAALVATLAGLTSIEVMAVVNHPLE